MPSLGGLRSCLRGFGKKLVMGYAESHFEPLSMMCSFPLGFEAWLLESRGITFSLKFELVPFYT